MQKTIASPLPSSSRGLENRLLALLKSLFASGFFLFFAPVAFGIMLLGFGDLIFKLFAFKEQLNLELFIQLAYIVGVVLFFAIQTTREALLEWLMGIEHAVGRLLNFFVVGFSDLLFGSRTGAAMTLYALFNIGLFVCGLLFASWAISTCPLQRVEAGMRSASVLAASHSRDTAIAGFLLSYALIALVLPVLIISRRQWRDMAIRPKLVETDLDSPVLLGVRQSSAMERGVRIAHLSDLHVRGAISDRGRNDDVLDAVAEQDVDIIALTGDLTDDGTEASWKRFLALPLLADRDERLVLVPGNHDLNTWHDKAWRTLSALESPSRTEASRRAYLYLQVASAIMGSRAWVCCPFTGTLRRLDQVYEHARPRLEAWDREADEPERLVPADFFRELFPMIVTTSCKGIACVVWNSVKPNRSPLFNSVGELGVDQIRRGEVLLANNRFAEIPLLHLLHHQIAMPRERPDSATPAASLLDRFHPIGMGLQTAEHLLGLIRKRSQQTCILHGHHHVYFVRREARSGAHIVSAPSTVSGTMTSYSRHYPAGKTPNWLLLDVAVDGVHARLRAVNPK